MIRNIYIFGLLLILSACNSEIEANHALTSQKSESTTEQSIAKEETSNKSLSKNKLMSIEEAIEIDYYNLSLINLIVGSADMYYYGNSDYFYIEHPIPTFEGIIDDLMNRLKPYMTENYINSTYYDYIANHCVACELPFTVRSAKGADSVKITVHNENEFTLHSVYEPAFLMDGGTFNVTYVKVNGQWKIDKTNHKINPSNITEPPLEETPEKEAAYTDLALDLKKQVDAMVETHYQTNDDYSLYSHQAEYRKHLAKKTEMYEKQMEQLLIYFKDISPLYTESKKIWDETINHSLDVIIDFEEGNNSVDIILTKHYDQQLINQMHYIFYTFGELLPNLEKYKASKNNI